MPGSDTLSRLRQLLLALVAVGLAGTAADLLLLNHVEDTLQFAPLVVIALSLVALGWHGLAGHDTSVRALRAAMWLLTATAATGIVLHYRGNMEFQLEMDPSLGGFDLLMTVLRAKSPPALAPANLALLGLVGLAATYKHPAVE
jgi:hypothetical protein